MVTVADHNNLQWIEKLLHAANALLFFILIVKEIQLFGVLVRTQNGFTVSDQRNLQCIKEFSLAFCIHIVKKDVCKNVDLLVFQLEHKMVSLCL